MVSGSWLNADGLLVQFGTQKANPDVAGDYKTYGASRVAEVLVDLKSLTTSPQVQSLTTFFPAGYNTFIEKVELDVDVASAGGTSFSVGLGYFSGSTYGNITTRSETSTSSAIGTQSNVASLPGVTAISNTAFVNALINASTNAAGDLITLSAGSTSAGGYIGAQSTDTTHKNYITALAAGTYTEGLIRVRIHYRGYGTIFN
jgi:hypothetical protein